MKVLTIYNKFIDYVFKCDKQIDLPCRFQLPAIPGREHLYFAMKIYKSYQV